MLYDKRWDQKAKSDPFSLEGLLAWLEMQPADKTYDYGCNGHCLLSQYFTHCGFRRVSVGGCHFNHGSDYSRSLEKLPPHFNDIAMDIEAVEDDRQPDWTFGGALKRARAAMCS